MNEFNDFNELCRSIIGLHPSMTYIGEIEGYNPYFNSDELITVVQKVLIQSGQPFTVGTEFPSLKEAMRNYVREYGEAQ